jgi:hypothetical protein
MELNRHFTTVYGKIKTGEDATVEDVLLYILYADKFHRDVRMFNLNEAKLIPMRELFSEELIQEASEERKARKIQEIKNTIRELNKELEILES